MNKAEAIRRTLRKTRARRKKQTCRTYELKIDRSHLNWQTREHLSRLPLEAKWLYNHALSEGIFSADYKAKKVRVKVKDRFEEREIRCLSSQMRQEIVDRAKDNVRGLNRKKKNGGRTGRLRFKSRVESIPLKQHGVTYQIIGRYNLKIQGVKQKLRVNGIEQLPKKAEIASATLLFRHGDCYLHVTAYLPKPKKQENPAPLKAVGVDFGVANQLTLSNGVRVQYGVPATKRLRRLHRTLSRRKRFGRNWQKTRSALDKEYGRANRAKKDITNKVSGEIVRRYGTVCFQHDCLRGWQRIWGRRMLNTSIGGIMSALNKAHTPIEVDRFFASTKKCSRCGRLQAVGLDERVFRCRACGLAIDRDLNAAINNEQEGLRMTGVPVVHRELTPADIRTTTQMLEYLNGIPRVRASPVDEAGSLTASA